VELRKQHPGSGWFRSTRWIEAANRRCPTEYSGREGPPVYPARIPEVSVRPVQTAEFQSHLPNKVKVRDHQAYDRRVEGRE